LQKKRGEARSGRGKEQVSEKNQPVSKSVRKGKRGGGSLVVPKRPQRLALGLLRRDEAPKNPDQKGFIGIKRRKKKETDRIKGR